MIALVWRVDEDPFGGTQWPKFHIRQHIQKNANSVSCAACLELVQVQAQTITSQERNVSLLWMPRGHVALASAVYDGGIVECGAIPSPVPVGKLRLYWIIWMSFEATVQPHLRRRSGNKFHFILLRLQYSAFALCYF